MGPGGFIKDPISAISFGIALMFGTAGLPHILMRFFTVPNAKEARKSVLWATTWIGYFYTGTITPLLKRLATAGRITRTRDVADERRVLIELTLAGEALHGQVQAVSGQIRTACQLTEKDMTCLQGTLDHLAWPADETDDR